MGLLDYLGLAWRLATVVFGVVIFLRLDIMCDRVKEIHETLTAPPVPIDTRVWDPTTGEEIDLLDDE